MLLSLHLSSLWTSNPMFEITKTWEINGHHRKPVLFQNPSILHDRVYHRSYDLKQANSNCCGSGFNFFFFQFISIPQISYWLNYLFSSRIPSGLFIIIFFLFFSLEGKSMETGQCRMYCEDSCSVQFRSSDSS